MSDPKSLTNEDAAKELLKNATLAALKVRKESKIRLSEKISRLWRGVFGFFMELRCRKGIHTPTGWVLWIEKQPLYSAKISDDQVTNSLPSSLQNVYIGKCRYCGKPHVCKLNNHAEQKDGYSKD
jgi:hypothetical protein